MSVGSYSRQPCRERKSEVIEFAEVRWSTAEILVEV
jgi:hypothetical protein